MPVGVVKTPVDLALSKPMKGGLRIPPLVVKDTCKVTTGPLKEKNKKILFGLEFDSCIKFANWEPGREYYGNIVLKNLELDIQKLTFSTPETRFFTSMFPKPISLSRGTTFHLPVTFKPLELKTYQDRIKFTGNQYCFDIPLVAVLPITDIEIPQCVMFGACAVGDTMQQCISVRNTGDLMADIRWSISSPFRIQPESAHIEVNAVQKFTVFFSPARSMNFKATASCFFSGETAKTTEFHGIGKFAYITIRPPLLPRSMTLPQDTINQPDAKQILVDFGKVALGSSKELCAQLINLSPVSVPFTIARDSFGLSDEGTFQCRIKEGIIPPMKSMDIPFIFQPGLLSAAVVDYFCVTTVGNSCRQVVKACGASMGPSLRLSCEFIDFELSDRYKTSVKTFELINDSDVDAYYQFDLGKSTIFSLDSMSATVPARKTRTITARFCPSLPIIYHRRVSCVVHNRGVLFIDIIGTCHTEASKPPVLRPWHVDRFSTRVQRGLSMFPPDQLSELLKDGKLLVDHDNCIYEANAEAIEPLLDPIALSPPFDKYFNDGYHSSFATDLLHVTADQHVFDFGSSCGLGSPIQPRTFSVTNHTRGKITLSWLTEATNPFTIEPPAMDIPAEQACSFTVSFRPTEIDQFYGDYIEGYAYFKLLRDHTLVDDIVISPSWCDTFLKVSEKYWPRHVDVSPEHVIFPGANPQHSVYRTVLLSNPSEIPILFQFESLESKLIEVKPTHGFLGAKQRQIFVLRSMSENAHNTHSNLTLRMNRDPRYSKVITASSSVEPPNVLLGNHGNLYFKPTNVSHSSSRRYSVRNVSSLPLRFEWKIKSIDMGVLSVVPEMGELAPNEIQYHTFTFRPHQIKKCVMKPDFVCWGIGDWGEPEPEQKTRFHVRVVAEGTCGILQASEPYYDFGPVMVGNPARQVVPIYNSSDCDIDYTLSYNRLSTDEDIPILESDPDSSIVQIESITGTVASRSRQGVGIVIRPLSRAAFQYSLSYRVKGDEESHHLCHLLINGVFPNLTVTDIWGEGSAMIFGKRQLWDYIGADSLNAGLAEEPSSDEIRYNMLTRQSYRRSPAFYTRSVIDMNFGSAPQDAEPCQVVVLIENSGLVPCDWQFLFPKDLELELEFWAETGEYTEKELHELQVQHNRLFHVHPKKGCLQPADSVQIKLTYSHIVPGTNKLPVLFKISKGREIMLNFIGVTAEPGVPYLHFASNRYMFTPTRVGQQDNVRHAYQLFNGGSVPVRFSVDTSPLDSLQLENYNYRILDCLTTEGFIDPGMSKSLEWEFSPLESKTYLVDVPIFTFPVLHDDEKCDKTNGIMNLITFAGVGYDSSDTNLKSHTMIENVLGTGVPVLQVIESPNQLAVLSRDRVSLGSLPKHAVVRQFLYVRNKSSSNIVNFEWMYTTDADRECIFVEPVTGLISPGCSQLCKLSYVAQGSPGFYDYHLICKVLNYTAKLEYEREILSWEAEYQRQLVEYTITEDDPFADERAEMKATMDSYNEAPRSIPDTPSNVMASQQSVNRYKTLPPIVRLTSDERREATKSEERRRKIIWDRPSAPLPTLLHLGVAVRTHNIDDFQHEFPDRWNELFVNRVLSNITEGHTEIAPPAHLDCVSHEEEMMEHALSKVIRSVLDDKDFHEAVCQIPSEAVPYFVQYAPPEPVVTSPTDSVFQANVVADQMPWQHESAFVDPGRVSVGTDSLQSLTGVGAYTKSFHANNLDILKMSTHEIDKIDGISEETAADHTAAEVDLKEVQTAETGATRGTSYERQYNLDSFIKRSPEFNVLLESLMENTVSNILKESNNNEFSITARQRLIALPPRPVPIATSPDLATEKPASSSPAALGKLSASTLKSSPICDSPPKAMHDRGDSKTKRGSAEKQSSSRLGSSQSPLKDSRQSS